MSYLQTRFNQKHQHRYFVDSNDGAAVCLCGKVRGSKKAAPNKYHAKTTMYEGVSYDSIFEANYAMQLDWRLKAKEIKAWERQYSVRIEINGQHILTTRVDFRIHHNDGSYELAETKGFETPDYRIKKRLIEVVWLPEQPDHCYTLVKEPYNYRVVQTLLQK
jgi:hypothetical protein